MHLPGDTTPSDIQGLKLRAFRNEWKFDRKGNNWSAATGRQTLTTNEEGYTVT
jgi:hypothetical protein